jgi:hypothetical protein
LDDGGERTIWRAFAAEHGAETVNRAIPHVRELYGMDGKPFTGKLPNSRKNRARWTECLSKARAEIMESAEIEDFDAIGIDA